MLFQSPGIFVVIVEHDVLYLQQKLTAHVGRNRMLAGRADKGQRHVPS